MVVLDRDNLVEKGKFSAVVKPDVAVFEVYEACDPYVQEMHDVNGLWDDLSLATKTVDEVDAEAAEWLEELCGRSHVALSGSGVSHFDLRFIREYMPKLDDRLTYWTFDVGVMRRICHLAGRPDLTPDWGETDKTHRALDDALVHANELRHYTALLTDF
jgi:oligoribonuclease